MGTRVFGNQYVFRLPTSLPTMVGRRNWYVQVWEDTAAGEEVGFSRTSGHSDRLALADDIHRFGTVLALVLREWVSAATLLAEVARAHRVDQKAVMADTQLAERGIRAEEILGWSELVRSVRGQEPATPLSGEPPEGLAAILRPDHLPEYFARDPKAEPALDLAYDGQASIVIRGARLRTYTDQGPDVDIDLTQFTLGELARTLHALPGYLVVLRGDPSWPAAALLNVRATIAGTVRLFAYRSVLWSVLGPIAREVRRLRELARRAFVEAGPPTASGRILDLFGELFGYPRDPGEDDERYTARLLALLTAFSQNGMALAISLRQLTGVPFSLSEPAALTFEARCLAELEPGRLETVLRAADRLLNARKTAGVAHRLLGTIQNASVAPDAPSARLTVVRLGSEKRVDWQAASETGYVELVDHDIVNDQPVRLYIRASKTADLVRPSLTHFGLGQAFRYLGTIRAGEVLMADTVTRRVWLWNLEQTEIITDIGGVLNYTEREWQDLQAPFEVITDPAGTLNYAPLPGHPIDVTDLVNLEWIREGFWVRHGAQPVGWACESGGSGSTVTFVWPSGFRILGG